MTHDELIAKIKEMLEINTHVDWDCGETSPEDEFRAILKYIEENE